MQTKDVTIYDCDNHSESIIVGYAAELLEQSLKTAIVIEVEDEKDVALSLGQLRVLFNKFIQYTTKIQLFIIGNSSIVSQMLQILPANIQFHNLDDQKQTEQILSFLTKTDNN
ncbi:hypothetical protein [Xanthocytophaga agilis]|uniref:Uncharacterized protein n=1 Tax=Xanthocytophaga agilis TaxID=3048010 RepID=A0AAE3R3C2_9BACT|nr:hypothetical protein [Xanthocytophaga agilis]MDJ1502385.1 hypothetical protein [Xanthocytophaga agilis]